MTSTHILELAMIGIRVLCFSAQERYCEISDRFLLTRMASEGPPPCPTTSIPFESINLVNQPKAQNFQIFPKFSCWIFAFSKGPKGYQQKTKN